MLTELSKQLGMSPSTVKEHMESLTKAGLVVMIDDGHKWKYYELTSKGKNVLHPADTKIWILLSISILALLVTAGDLIRLYTPTQAFMLTESAPAMDMVRAPAAGGSPEMAPMMQTAAQLPYFHIASFILFGVLAALCASYIIRRRS